MSVHVVLLMGLLSMMLYNFKYGRLKDLLDGAVLDLQISAILRNSKYNQIIDVYTIVWSFLVWVPSWC